MNTSVASANTPTSASEHDAGLDVRRAEVLRTLGHLARGLSAVFWGLPLVLLLDVQTARTDWMEAIGWFAMLPALAANGLIVYGLTQMRHFQKQERVWRAALDRAVFVGWVNVGLSPFLFWWHLMAFVPFYRVAVSFLALSSLLFLSCLNNLLKRLTAMLPDETLRHETRLFASLNRNLLAVVMLVLVAYAALSPLEGLPRAVSAALAWMDDVGLWALLFLILMPLAMSMSLVWKIKEVIFTSVFEAQH
jgi:hypothetical protein